MNDLPPERPVPEPGNLRFLRRLVTVLTATMILGMVTVVALLVLRFNQSAPTMVVLPEEITLPEGVTARAFTSGTGWYGIVTTDDAILIYDSETGALRQRVEIVSR